jgi:hypothetical protein
MWMAPAGVPHLLPIIGEVDKPLIMSDFRPFGSGSIGAPPKALWQASGSNPLGAFPILT